MAEREKERLVDEELDVTSAKFDPLKALYAGPDKVKLPFPNMKALDNLQKYAFLTSRLSKSSEGTSQGSRKGDEPTPSTSLEGQATETPSTPPVRQRFLPHQMPIPAKPFVARNVLTRMENCTEGPLGMLKKCVDRRLHVRVWTRNMEKVRGYCSAFIVAFDKHWNMALVDVEEVFERKTKRKVPVLGTPLKHSRYSRPRVVIEKSSKKTEICHRHVKQLLIRGEQVVMVSVLDF